MITDDPKKLIDSLYGQRDDLFINENEIANNFSYIIYTCMPSKGNLKSSYNFVENKKV